MVEQTVFTVMDSPLCGILLAGNEYGLTQVAFQDGKSPLFPASDWWRDDAVWATAVTLLAAYFAGELQTFDLPLAPKGTPFQQKVWA